MMFAILKMNVIKLDFKWEVIQCIPITSTYTILYIFSARKILQKNGCRGQSLVMKLTSSMGMTGTRTLWTELDGSSTCIL